MPSDCFRNTLTTTALKSFGASGARLDTSHQTGDREPAGVRVDCEDNGDDVIKEQ